jgi:hypothetical protein
LTKTKNLGEKVAMNLQSVCFGGESINSDGDHESWLKSLRWSAAAPADLVQSAQSGSVEKFWRVWSRRVAVFRTAPPRKARSSNGRLLWPWDGIQKHPARELLSLLQPTLGNRLARWAERQRASGDAWKTDRTELELLSLADWLLNAPRVTADVGWPVWRLTLTRAVELAEYLSKPLTCDLTADRRLLVTGELRCLVGLLFRDLEGASAVQQLGEQSLRNELVELTDGDGTPAANLLPVLPGWLASLIRSVELGQATGQTLLDRESLLQFEDLITKSTMLLDGAGWLLTGQRERSSRHGGRNSTSCLTPHVEMLLNAARLAGMDELSLAAESLRFRQHVAAGKPKDRFQSETFSESPEERLIVTDTDLPATQSDWAAWACLRNWWHAEANTVVVRHDGAEIDLQVCTQGIPVVCGTWSLTVRLDGEPLAWDAAWKCSCWSSDPDMDYIELQLEVPRGPMLCRQLLVSRKDQFLVLADIVSGAGRHRIDLESRLPLCRGVKSKADSATREMRLNVNGLSVRCFPLALPDDRLHGTAGVLESLLGDLRLQQASSQESLYAPLVLDWSTERKSLPAEWRTLTITEAGRKLNPWEAAGHRLRCGNLHLVVYRSLQSSEESRAVLGLHTDKETVIANFNDKGYVLPIVSVEA